MALRAVDLFLCKPSRVFDRLLDVRTFEVRVAGENLVERQFVAGLRNFFELYRNIVDGWRVYDNSAVTGPRLIAHGVAGASATIADMAAWKRLEELE